MSEACLVPGCDRRRMTVGALCGPHSRDGDTAEMYDQGEEGTGTVTTLQEYREQQAEPPSTDPDVKPYACTEPGCTFASTRIQGLSRHRNQSHGIRDTPAKVTPPKAAAPKNGLRDSRITLDLTPDEIDVLDAVAFLDDTTREKVLTTIVTRFIAEQPEYVTAFAGKRGERRA